MKVSELSDEEYHIYYKGYLEAAGEGDLLSLLKDTLLAFSEFIKEIPNDKLSYRYADKKWTVADVLLHLFDAERVFQYRALRFARNDQTPLSGFKQDDYVPASRANERNKASLVDEYISIRKSTISLFESLSPEDLMRSGIASGVKMSVRALGFVIIGHQKHHQNILMDRYLQQD